MVDCSVSLDGEGTQTLLGQGPRQLDGMYVKEGAEYPSGDIRTVACVAVTVQSVIPQSDYLSPHRACRNAVCSARIAWHSRAAA